MAAVLKGDGTYRDVILRVEITRLFIPNSDITDSFCISGESCCPPSIPTPPVDNECFNTTTATDSAGDSTEIDPDCVYDPDAPPLWWLTSERDRICALVATGFFNTLQTQCNALQYFVSHYGSIGGFGLEWSILLDTWRQVGAALTYDHCNPPGSDSAQPGALTAELYDKISVTKTRIRFPAGTRIISRRCVDMHLDDVCDLCQ